MDVKPMLRSLLRKGFTEHTIAAFVNVHQSTISRILSGKIQDPKSSLAHRIKKLFDQQSISDLKTQKNLSAVIFLKSD